MKINEVVKLTGLTKKAIRYYEEKELIFSNVNSENGYKDYSRETIEDLKVIAFLRNIEMSVIEIKKYLDFSNERERILRKHLEHIDNKMNHLETVKEVIKRALNEKSNDFYKLNSYLVKKQVVDNDFVLKRLASLFPDAFGKYIIIHFGSFMNEPLDTEEKQIAFNEIIQFLDSIDNIVFPDKYVEYLNQINERELIEGFRNIDNKCKEWSNINPKNKNEIEELKKEFESYVKMQYSIEYQEQYQEMKRIREQMRKSMEESGYYNKFIKNLKIISRSYSEYIERLEKINRTLGLEYDDEGNIIMNK
ncbi:MerR family transcriptional regulator [Wukongibacter sp. M2B1]|uniref:MerR family transcriptional regulator n=1 Tax=Wukongibacter sp. M2B1 TaxID=3088895 RepID=UPI003D7C0254